MSFERAARPEEAIKLYDYFVEVLRRGPIPVETGVFQAMIDDLRATHRRAEVHSIAIEGIEGNYGTVRSPTSS